MCARVESAKRCGYGWLHRLTDPMPQFAARPLSPVNPEVPRASDHDLDCVYQAILGNLQLDARHRIELRHRGLTDSYIQRAAYRTLPSSCRAGIIRRLRDSSCSMLPSMSSDPLTIIDRLDSTQLKARLAKLDKQRSALIVLLRATLARERSGRRPRKRGARHA
jgi:hypothetical protein